MQLEFTELKGYLEERFGAAVQLQDVSQLDGGVTGAAALKQFGYGRPFLVSYRIGDRVERLVFHRINRNAFGHERDDDRAAAVWLDFKTFNHLARHARALDMIAQTNEGKIQSLSAIEELFLVTSHCPGRPYADDLVRLRDEGTSQSLDIRRVEALAVYLAKIHQVKQADPMLWQRRLRDLVGHGEGIMGLTDSYATELTFVTEAELRTLEEMANRWRWQLKPLNHRLSQVHGDFHPFNILFEKDTEFHLLDRSRGEWGEPADDVSCLAINYLFFSLQRSGRLAEPFRELHDRFWEQYLTVRTDEELPQVIQPWFAWRALVLASPIWYPTISEETRRKLLTFARRVMATDWYDYRQVNQYLEAV
jgi:aminoglycoside phosphotransferase (APT) family kinase protein